ncbi:hypothetical protein [Nocardia donostiensis]|uniref:Uncharacterized protein n=1 Tax=Nocardia donostiensis TaxID=1538463 RepID=A0A1V2TH15_9NOCA|nr:hypothetical protein [Nocardia donostiensis]ONM48809.1 hypothetical protein B0T46_09975 [Nocardia donostiensis]OQS12991.1 hypothetical protein B0T36_21980 [Nocardia donostiensis]OQS22936.1 hypothetical protein B0T44_04490 [Nocardia donostiensis]
MSDLVTRAQIILLARTLHVAPERIAHLERLGAECLHELQQRMAAVIFAQHAETFRRISKLVPIIPLSVSMPLVQRLVPPAMTGRAAGAIGAEHPKKAAETIALLGVSYAADCAPYMDPRTVGPLADAAPAEPIMEVLAEVLRRRDYVTAGPFLGYATPRLIEAVERGVHDDEGLIFAAAYAYSSASINAILRQFVAGSQQRIPQVLQTVLAGSTALQQAALSVLARCEPDLMAELADILFSVGSSEAVGHLIATAIHVGAAAELLTFIGHAGSASLARVAVNPIFGNDAVLAALLGAIAGRPEVGAWRGLLALAERTGAATQQRIAGLLAGLPDSALAALPSVAAEADLWPMLLPVIAAGGPEVHTRIGAVWANLPQERIAGLEMRIHESGLDTRLAALTRQVPSVSVEEVFFRRRRMGRRRNVPESWEE